MIKINHIRDFIFVGDVLLPCKYVYFNCEHIAFIRYAFVRSCKSKSKYLKFYEEYNGPVGPTLDITMSIYPR